jgi:Mn2+/Fe2+ NRAMP family transporter
MRHRHPRARLLRAFALSSAAGIVGLALTAFLGFEEPDTTLVVVSSVLLFAAPVAMLVHLSLTRELTRQEKRIWLRQLTGRRAARAFSEYLTSQDRRATARRLARPSPIRPTRMS